MLARVCLVLFASVVAVVIARPRATQDFGESRPQYTTDGQLRFPEHYREWVYLSSGFDMSYQPVAKRSTPHVFDNVFANPQAYKAFVANGSWPEGTMLVLEVREATERGSINQSGEYQNAAVSGLEVHVKDSAHFPGKWAFFDFSNLKTSKMIPQTADCYACHSKHAAVDTTFVQFYPTLLPVASARHTLSPAYLKDSSPTNR